MLFKEFSDLQFTKWGLRIQLCSSNSMKIIFFFVILFNLLLTEILRPAQIPHGQARARTRVSAVRG
jgi:hypothetical protein